MAMVARHKHKAKLISEVRPEACIFWHEQTSEKSYQPIKHKGRSHLLAAEGECSALRLTKASQVIAMDGWMGRSVPMFHHVSTRPPGHRRSNEVNEQGRNDSLIQPQIAVMKEGGCLCFASSTVRLGVGGLFTARCDATAAASPQSRPSSRRCAVAVPTADVT